MLFLVLPASLRTAVTATPAKSVTPTERVFKHPGLVLGGGEGGARQSCTSLQALGQRRSLEPGVQTGLQADAELAKTDDARLGLAQGEDPRYWP